LNAAKTDLEKGWYVTSLYDSSSVMAVIVSREQGDNELFDTSSFEEKYDYLLGELKSSLNINKQENVWSKMFFDHAMYFYNSYKFYQNTNDTKSKSDLRTANSITNIAFYLYETEDKVLEYYNSADVSEISNSNSTANGSNAKNNDKQDGSNQNVYVYGRSETYLYVIVLGILIIVLGVIIELRKLKRFGKKELIQKHIMDIDEKVVAGEISQFTYRELRNKYLEELKELKVANVQSKELALPIKAAVAPEKEVEQSAKKKPAIIKKQKPMIKKKKK
jgi:hypothetical protein